MKRQLSIYLGVAVTTTVGHSALVALPLEVGAIVDGLGLSTSRVGVLVTIELVCYALTNIAISPVIGRLPARRIAQIGALLVIAAEVISAFTAQIGLFAVGRGLAGIGFGIVFACANACGAQAAVPERAYSIGLGVSILFYSVLPIVLAQSLLLNRLAPDVLLPHSGVFLVIAAFVLALLPAMNFLPAEPNQNRLSSVRSPGDRIALGAAAGTLVLMALFAIGFFGLYTFIERRARTLGMTSAEIGSFLSATFAIGMMGTVASTWLGRRVGLAVPLVGALVLQGVSCLAVATTQTPVVVCVSAFVFMSIWYFVYPYIFALGADTDPLGRVPTAIGGVYLVGSSVATSVGGFLLQSGGYVAVGWTACAFCVAAAFVAFPLARSIDRRSQRGNTRAQWVSQAPG